MARHLRPAQLAGRHRIGRPGLVHCAMIPAVAQRLDRRSWSWLRMRPAGRHTWGWLARSGGTPRTAFALMLSL